MIKLKSSEIKAAIFDLDGVITQTDELHANAWREAFDEYNNQREESGKSRFANFKIEEDYRHHVDGKPRYKGVNSFLESRKIHLPWGNINDKDDVESVCGIGNRKNRIYQNLLATLGPKVFEDAVEQIKNWKKKGIKTAVVSSSRNCQKVLKAAKIENLFTVRVDGNDLQSFHLLGKPAPDMFIEAAKRLQVDPQNCLMVEDAKVGIEAGRKAHIRYVIARDLKGRERSLKEYGANFVVESLKEIEIVELIDPLPLFENCKTEVFKETIRGRRPVFFFDYDGTLTPIVNRPENAHLPQNIKEIIREIAQSYSVIILSGRDRLDVEKMVGIENIIYGGSHGFDIQGPNEISLQMQEAQNSLSQLDQAEEIFKNIVEKEKIKGLWVERKKYALAIHFREADNAEIIDRISQEIDETLKNFKGLKRTEGKKVFNFLPNIPWDKGRALLWILERIKTQRETFIPLYFGDDLTDEDAFFAIRNIGIGILVSEDPRPSEAKYWIKDSEAVPKALKLLLSEFEDTKLEMEITEWTLVYNHWNPEQQPLRETICTLGNGYFATRGSFPEEKAGGAHYPGTYITGGYNRAETKLADNIIENEDIVNWPNWLSLSFRYLEEENWWKLEDLDIKKISFLQELNVKEGILKRTLDFVDKKNRKTQIIERRFVHMDNPHVAGLEWTLTPHNWNGIIFIRSALDGEIKNSGVERYKALNSKHFEILETGLAAENSIYLVARSLQSHLVLTQAARLQATVNKVSACAIRSTHQTENKIWQEIEIKCHQHKSLKIEKIVSIYTSKDMAISNPILEAKKVIRQLPGFSEFIISHKEAWSQLWNRCDIELEDGTYTQFILRLHIFHLLQTTSLHTIELDAGVPARGLHGEAYRGHIFWDEVFIFPFLNLRIPEITRSLLMYRYRRLPEAKRSAATNGYRGAMYPWQSGSDGREETPKLQLNPKSGRWIPDNTQYQRHIGAAIAYNTWHYYQCTADIEFLSFYGAKMILEIALFFSSLATFNPKRQRYDILGVVGPDEFHTQYPGTERPGIDNNAYTNIMAAWLFNHALCALEILGEDRQRELKSELSITEEDLTKWKNLQRNIFIPFLNDEKNLLAQFEGYENLKEFPWTEYREKYADIHRLDRILRAENDSPNNYKIGKQADVIMIFYLFSTEELQEIFQRLGYKFDPKMIPDNIDYYIRRVSHGSTLSRVVHSWVLSRLDRPRSLNLFCEALSSDISDIQGGTTSEGIHLGAMAGTVDIIQRCYPGIEVRENVLWFNPCLPKNLKGINFRLRFQGHQLRVRITQSKLIIQFDKNWVGPVTIGFADETFEMHQGDLKEFSL